MEKMFTVEIDEQITQNTWKRSEVLKLFLVIVAVFVVILLLIITGMIYLAFQPNNSVQPLTLKNTPNDYQALSLTQNIQEYDQHFPLPVNVPETDQVAPLTFNFVNSISQSNLTGGNFTCFIENSEHPCSHLFTKWNNITRSALQQQLIENKLIDSVFYWEKLTFDHNNNVIYEVREKYQFYQYGGSNSNKLNAETVFKSKDFDWNEKVTFGPDKMTIPVYIESFKDGMNYYYYPCTIDQAQFDSSECSMGQPNVKKMKNLALAVFGLKDLNLTWTIGITPDWHMVISEYGLIGKLPTGTTPRHISRKIKLLDEQLRAFCNCTSIHGIPWALEREVADCSGFRTTKNPFREVFDESLCPSRLEKEIRNYNPFIPSTIRSDEFMQMFDEDFYEKYLDYSLF